MILLYLLKNISTKLCTEHIILNTDVCIDTTPISKGALLKYVPHW